MAAGQGKIEVVRLLIKAKALVNIQNKVYTSLFIAWQGEEQLILEHLCVMSELQ